MLLQRVRNAFQGKWGAWLLSACVCMSMAVLAWFGFTAVRGWQRSALALAERRADSTAESLAAALSANMSAVHRSVLFAPAWTPDVLASPADLVDSLESPLSQYSYPEWFFAASINPSEQSILVARRDRRPQWLTTAPDLTGRVAIGIRNPSIAPLLMAHAIADARERRPVSVFDTTLNGTTYQIVLRLLYQTGFRIQLRAVVGFGVNLQWARDHYFTEQIRSAASDDAVAIQVVNEHGAVVTGTSMRGQGPSAQRPFQFTFFDLGLLPNPASETPHERWMVRAISSNDETLAAASGGAVRIIVFGALAVGTLLVGFGLAVRARATSIKLAELRGDFVSSVTHELKTPIATIRAAGETLLAGRISNADARREYAEIVVHEAKRLTQLIENLLAFSRITDTDTVRSVEPVQVSDLVNDTLRRFDLRLREEGFAVTVALPPDFPCVLGDRAALRLMLDNIVDNAIRYTRHLRSLTVQGRTADGYLSLEIADRGIGIHPKDIPHVMKKFFRARNVNTGGAGIGLAIARRIANDHGGRIEIASAIDVGTTVTVKLPVAAMQFGSAT